MRRLKTRMMPARKKGDELYWEELRGAMLKIIHIHYTVARYLHIKKKKFLIGDLFSAFSGCYNEKHDLLRGRKKK